MPKGACKLCLQERELQDSHLLPAGILTSIREPTLKNPNPVVVTPDIAMQSSKPFKHYLLCRECEQLFSQKGEAYVCAAAAKVGAFPLWERLQPIKAQPVETHFDFDLYRGLELIGPRLEDLVYFGLSVFWRSATHHWQMFNHTAHIELGSFEDPLRRFLRSESSFPENLGLAISLWPSQPVLIGAYCPLEFEQRGFSQFRFYIPGIEFSLFTGERLPAGVRAHCAYSSPLRLVAVSKVPNHNAAALMKGALDRAKPSAKLSMLWAGPDPREQG